MTPALDGALCTICWRRSYDADAPRWEPPKPEDRNLVVGFCRRCAGECDPARRRWARRHSARRPSGSSGSRQHGSAGSRRGLREEFSPIGDPRSGRFSLRLLLGLVHLILPCHFCEGVPPVTRRNISLTSLLFGSRGKPWPGAPRGCRTSAKPCRARSGRPRPRARSARGGPPSPCRHGREAAGDCQVLAQHVEGAHPADGGQDGQAHRVAEQFLVL